MRNEKFVSSETFLGFQARRTYKKAEYEGETELEENLEVDEVNLTSSSLEGKKSYKDVIWQWDDAAWIMCAVLMTFTMQVILYLNGLC